MTWRPNKWSSVFSFLLHGNCKLNTYKWCCSQYQGEDVDEHNPSSSAENIPEWLALGVTGGQKYVCSQIWNIWITPHHRWEIWEPLLPVWSTGSGSSGLAVNVTGCLSNSCLSCGCTPGHFDMWEPLVSWIRRSSCTSAIKGWGNEWNGLFPAP